MREIQIFNNPEFGEVRTMDVDGEAWFVASDVAKALGYTKPANAIAAHCRYTLKRGIPHPQGKGTMEVNTIPEGDLYRLVAKSELPAAEKFESWVFDEVLPAIRKTGSYQIAKMATEHEKVNIQMDKARASLANARAKQAKLLLEIADRAQVEMYRSIIIAKAANLLAEENLLPMPRSEQQRSRHGLAYFCRMVGKPETWASQMGKELLKAGIEKKPGENGEYIETTAKGGGKQVQGFEWFDDYLTPIVMRMFTHAPESEI